MIFADRADAGRRLAESLAGLVGGEDVVVLGLPRGGVVVAAEVAERLGAPLDVLVVRKLGVPLLPELAMGAIGEGGLRLVLDDVLDATGVSPAQLADEERHERAELERRLRRYRGSRPAVPLAGRTAVVVDDGVATGSTARVACEAARQGGAGKVVLAVPIAPQGFEATIGDVADRVVALQTPASFRSISEHYLDFAQTSDAEVVACLERAGEDAR